MFVSSPTVACKILYPDGVIFDTYGSRKDILSYETAVTVLKGGYEVLVLPETCQRLIAHFIRAGWPLHSNRITV